MAEYNYAALASTIKIEDITSDKHNQSILQRLRDNDTSLDKLWIYNKECDDIGDSSDNDDYYAPDHVEELGWLGYYIGQNTTLTRIYFYENRHSNMYESERPFFEGLSCNKTIQSIDFDGFNLSEGRLFSLMTSFLKSNNSLSKIEIENCEFGLEGTRHLSLAIGKCNKSLKELRMDNNRMENGQVADIITALSMHPQLTELRLSHVNVGRNECTALSTLLRWTTTKLITLNLRGNNIDDEGLEYIVNALANINTLQELNLGFNPSITMKGWKRVSTLLNMPGSTLQKLIVSTNNIRDEGALVFANALVNNSTLKLLGIQNIGITTEGWAPFSKLLCDTSSVNNTYLSNHTLKSFYSISLTAVPDDVRSLMVLNGIDDKRQVAITKILQNHSHFDMRYFFEWEFSVLPIMISWFTKAAASTTEYDEKIKKMKLSVLYDFIREFPMFYVEARTQEEIKKHTCLEMQLQQAQLQLASQLEEVQRCKARAMRRLSRRKV